MSEQELKPGQEQGDQLEDKNTPEHIAELLKNLETENKLREEIRKLHRPIEECYAPLEQLYNMAHMIPDSGGMIDRNEEKADFVRLEVANALIELNKLLREMGAQELKVE
ncbi:MAG: hypothetical protein WC242_01745 [Candidatus Paceibacterota bacterium]|jgi:hypothetical protein